MLKLLFNRTSLLVRFLELAGVTVGAVYVVRDHDKGGILFESFLYILVSYLLVRLCDIFPWYGREKSGGDPKKTGIRVHFRKALVPTSYILAVTSLFCLIGIPFVSLSLCIFSGLLMTVITSVNGILIYFHFKDRETLPINYFSHGKYRTSPVRPPEADRHPFLTSTLDQK